MKWIKIILAAIRAAIGQYEETSDVTVNPAQVKDAQTEVAKQAKSVAQAAVQGSEGIKEVEADGRSEVAAANPEMSARSAVDDFLRRRQRTR